MKETFIIRSEWWDSIQELSIEDRSILFDNLFHYHREDFDKINLNNLSVKLVWKLIEPQLRRNIEAYDKRVETSRENGKKGGRPPGAKKIVPIKKPNKPSITLSDIDSDIVKEEKKPPKPQKLKKYFTKKVKETLSECLEYFPENLHPKTESQVDSWLDEIEKLNRIDKYSFAQIVGIVKGARENDFWRKNFLSLTKLRKKNRDQVAYIVVFEEQFDESGGKAKFISHEQLVKLNNTNPGSFDNYKAVRIEGNQKPVWVSNEHFKLYKLRAWKN